MNNLETTKIYRNAVNIFDGIHQISINFAKKNCTVATTLQEIEPRQTLDRLLSSNS